MKIKRGGCIMTRKKYRREKQKEGRGYIFIPLLFFFFFFPFFMSRYSEVERSKLTIKNSPGQVWVMEKRLWGNYSMELEQYLIGMMAATIPGEYEMETLKAQAILLRSFCLSPFLCSFPWPFLRSVPFCFFSSFYRLFSSCVCLFCR